MITDKDKLLTVRSQGWQNMTLQNLNQKWLILKSSHFPNLTCQLIYRRTKVYKIHKNVVKSFRPKIETAYLSFFSHVRIITCPASSTMTTLASIIWTKCRYFAAPDVVRPTTSACRMIDALSIRRTSSKCFEMSDMRAKSWRNFTNRLWSFERVRFKQISDNWLRQSAKSFSRFFSNL